MSNVWLIQKEKMSYKLFLRKLKKMSHRSLYYSQHRRLTKTGQIFVEVEALP